MDPVAKQRSGAPDVTTAEIKRDASDEAIRLRAGVARQIGSFESALPEMLTFDLYINAIGGSCPAAGSDDLACSHGVSREENCERCAQAAFECRYEFLQRWFEFRTAEDPDAVAYLAARATEWLIAYERERRRPLSPHIGALQDTIHRLSDLRTIHRGAQPWYGLRSRGGT